MSTQQLGSRLYAGQFDLAPDLLYVAIPRDEIIAEMVVQGEDVTLSRVCNAVACVLEAVEACRAHG